MRDSDGYYFILGRTDDVINVAGYRLGTREIEESVTSHPLVAECAVVGVADQLKGQVAIAFAVLRDASRGNSAEDRSVLEKEIMGCGRQAVGRGGPSCTRPCDYVFAQNALRKGIASLDPGYLRGTRPRRPHYH